MTEISIQFFVYMRILHKGSALAFQARGTGSSPVIRYCAIEFFDM